MPQKILPVSGTRMTPSAGRAVADQTDIHGEIVAAADELARAVERIDEEELGPGRGHLARRGRLLGNHGNAGRDFSQMRHDHCLGGAVGLRDRTGVGFPLDAMAAPADGKDGVAGLDCGGNQGFDKVGVGGKGNGGVHPRVSIGISGESKHPRLRDATEKQRPATEGGPSR